MFFFTFLLEMRFVWRYEINIKSKKVFPLSKHNVIEKWVSEGMFLLAEKI
jgi:hypothetical protein